MPVAAMFAKVKDFPKVGEIIDVVDKQAGAKPERVRVTDIKVHVGGGEIYFVERF